MLPLIYSACNCCKDGTDDGSFTCDASGNCGLCGVGFFGDKCCGSTYSLFHIPCIVTCWKVMHNYMNINMFVSTAACPCCTENTLTGTNVCDANGKCECLAGFSGDDCCENSVFHFEYNIIL